MSKVDTTFLNTNRTSTEFDVLRKAINDNAERIERLEARADGRLLMVQGDTFHPDEIEIALTRKDAPYLCPVCGGEMRPASSGGYRWWECDELDSDGCGLSTGIRETEVSAFADVRKLCGRKR